MTSQGAAARQAVGEQRGRAEPVIWERPDTRRWLQLGLAAMWLLDGVLQYQPVMFTRAFGQMLAGSASGNPAVIAEPITWAARIIEHNPTPTNAAFATIQVALGLGIAWRRTLRVTLAASIAWSLAVWWFGEGLGGVLLGDASPFEAPGAVILYALLAVLLWPAASAINGAANTARRGLGSFVAERPLGARAARALWLVLWGSLAYFTVLPANRAPQGLHDMITEMAAGEPSWLASINRGAASVLAHHGLAASVVLAVILAAIAVGIFLPRPLARVTVVAAVVVSLAICLVAQDLGAILAGGSTDVNSGPLLALIALAYWPLAAARVSSDARDSGAALGAGVPLATESSSSGGASAPGEGPGRSQGAAR